MFFLHKPAGQKSEAEQVSQRRNALCQ
jgi:hypothetical protein